MSTADQTHSAPIHGEALVAAERLVNNPAIDPLLRRLAEVTVSRMTGRKPLGTSLAKPFAHLPKAEAIWVTGSLQLAC
jgi:hypothetical protein